MRAAPITGPSSVPSPPMIAMSASCTETSSEKVWAGSIQSTYWA